MPPVLAPDSRPRTDLSRAQAYFMLEKTLAEPIIEAEEDQEQELQEETVPARAFQALDSTDRTADSSSNSDPHSSGDSRHAIKIDHRSNLRTVKRNLLMCYDDASEGVSEAIRPGPRSALRAKHPDRSSEINEESIACQGDALRGMHMEESDEASSEILETRRPLRAQRAVLDSPTFSATGDAASANARSWTDVDLSRWATVSKIALSPVARGSTASPMPVVLRHRVVHQPIASAIELEDHSKGSVVETDVGMEALENDEVDNSLHTVRAIVMDMDRENIASELQRQTGAAIDLPLLRIQEDMIHYEASCMAQEAREHESRASFSPGALFDRSAEAEAAEGDSILHCTLLKIFEGPRRGTPLTSRYSGSDPELQQVSQIKKADAHALAAACVAALPLSCVCEGKRLLFDFEEMPLYETVAHPSSELMQFRYPGNASPGDKEGVIRLPFRPRAVYICDLSLCSIILKFYLPQGLCCIFPHESSPEHSPCDYRNSNKSLHTK